MLRVQEGDRVLVARGLFVEDVPGRPEADAAMQRGGVDAGAAAGSESEYLLTEGYSAAQASDGTVGAFPVRR